MATEAWCDTCNTEPTAGMFCERCVEAKVEQAREEGERDADPQNCDRCGARPADCCDDCAKGDLAHVASEWAARRKALGLLTTECFEAFELFVSDLEAGDA